jgi:single-strand DNA-binding protein
LYFYFSELNDYYMSVNKAILIGNVGNDPEVRYLEGGTSVARFSLATSEVYKNKSGEKVTQTEWHNIVAWRHLAELAEKYIKKGRQLYVDGRIINRSWEDKEGNKRYTTEIVAGSIQLLGRKGDNDTAPATPVESQSKEAKPENTDFSKDQSEDDDLPF